MDTGMIRKMIDAAVEEEKRSGQLADIVREAAKQQGTQPTPEQVLATVAFVRDYVQHVPYFIEQGVAAAQAAGLSAEMAQVVSELEAYWREAEDVIPDRVGLAGLTDDAYASLFLLQAISDWCKNTAGRPLLERDLAPANQVIRQLLGAPIAVNLETRVGITIGKAMMQRMMMQLARSPGFSMGAGPDPIWGNASTQEIVNARLGAMGIF